MSTTPTGPSTPTVTLTATLSLSRTPTAPLTPTSTVSPTPTSSRTPTAPLTPTSTVSPTPTSSLTHTTPLTPTLTVSLTPTFSPTPTATSSPTPTTSRTPTFTLTITLPPTPTMTASLTPTFTPTHTETSSSSLTTSLTPTFTLTPSATATPSRTISLTATTSPTPTATLTLTLTASLTPTFTSTLTPTLTPTPTTTLTPTLSLTPTATLTPTLTDSLTPTLSLTPTATLTPTPTISLTSTLSLTPTATLTPTPTISLTSTLTLTPTATLTPTPSVTLTATPSPYDFPNLVFTASLFDVSIDQLMVQFTVAATAATAHKEHPYGAYVLISYQADSHVSNSRGFDVTKHFSGIDPRNCPSQDVYINEHHDAVLQKCFFNSFMPQSNPSMTEVFHTLIPKSAAYGLSLSGMLISSDAVITDNCLTLSCPSIGTPYLSRVSGCRDVGNATVNCAPDGRYPLTITGKYFGALASIDVWIGGVPCPDAYADLSGANDTIVCPSYGYTGKGRNLPIVVEGVVYGNVTNFTATGVAVSFTPAIERVVADSGCDAAGTQTITDTCNTDPYVVVTLTGGPFDDDDFEVYFTGSHGEQYKGLVAQRNTDTVVANISAGWDTRVDTVLTPRVVVGGVASLPGEGQQLTITTSRPTVTRISGCRDVANGTTDCRSNAQLILTGTRLPAYSSARILMVTADGDGFEAIGLANDGSTTLHLAIDNNETRFQGTALYPLLCDGSLCSTFPPPDGAFLTLAVRPAISTVSGCHGSIASCPTSGSSLTIAGKGFLGAPGTPLVSIGCPGQELPCAITTEAPTDSLLVCDIIGSANSGATCVVDLRHGPELVRADDIVTFRTIPIVTAVSGCEDEGYGTAKCARNASTITVKGKYLGGETDHITVWAGDVMCEYAVPSTGLQLEARCAGKGYNNTVVVVVNGERSKELWGYVSYEPQCPTTTSEHCSGHGRCIGELDLCVCDVEWSKEDCSDCSSGRWGSSCSRACQGGVATPCSLHGTCDAGVTGTGKCTCDTFYAGETCSIRCPSTNEGVTCNGFTCNDGAGNTGTCTCGGHFVGDACEECEEGYYGERCDMSCVCSAYGRCDSGVNGSDACFCQAGHTGKRCELHCAVGTNGEPCSGRGNCTEVEGLAVCECDMGYDSTTACSSCVFNYAGANCTLPCQGVDEGAKTVCSGHGTCRASDAACICSDKYCGSDCSVTPEICEKTKCDPPQNYGLLCDSVCPGYAKSGAVCYGRGECSAGPLGSGECNCTRGYNGTACEHDCTVCVGNNGMCDITGECTCSYGRNGVNCVHMCDTYNGEPCGGAARGTCPVEDTVAPCQCLPEFRGSGCQHQCPGYDTATQTVCSGHGTCSDNGECKCDPSTPYVGTACNECPVPYLLPYCVHTCPGKKGLTVCNGHGVCNALADGRGLCNCTSSLVHGFWDGDGCTDCEFGYYGPRCVDECPGSACRPCFGHGVCSDGPSGSGGCTCHEGWTPPCNNCTTEYYGETCSDRCPVGLNGMVCSGNGRCSSGISGTGECMCFEGFDGAKCDRCHEAYYGSGCSNKCPGTITYDNGTVVPCRGFGKCEVEGENAVCKCIPSRRGEMCEIACGETEKGVCNNKGVCDEVLSRCVCSQGPLVGFWAGEKCNTCVEGYWGEGCLDKCDCNGRGIGGCKQDGTCVCETGFSGERCEQECPGGRWNPCNKHGTCLSDVSCQCEASASTGFWNGSACEKCYWNMTGPECKTECVKAHDGTVCGGHGWCRYSDLGNRPICVCDAEWCGSDCTLKSELCGCTADTYGASGVCTLCPGGGTCSGHGRCDSYDYGTGVCYCDDGYNGWECAHTCSECDPLGTELCAPNQDAQCQCRAGYSGRSCSKACPGKAEICSGHGKCSEGNTGSGDCRCNTGYTKEDCSVACPGWVLLGDLVQGVCSGHGTCDEVGECTCDSQYAGSGCERCADRRLGADCSILCEHGMYFAGNLTCKCHPGHGGAGCSIECPFTITSEGVRANCSNNGICNPDDGTCNCNDGYYGKDCSVPCDKRQCKPEGRSMCSAEGQCTCLPQFTVQSGCTECSSGYWGDTCSGICDCVNGKCNNINGQCECPRNSDEGYWDGIRCQRCLDGYIGVNCQETNVVITRVSTGDIRPPVAITDNSRGILVIDYSYRVMYVGTNPVLALSLTTGAVLGQHRFDITGATSVAALISGCGAGRCITFMCTNHNQYTFPVVEGVVVSDWKPLTSSLGRSVRPLQGAPAPTVAADVPAREPVISFYEYQPRLDQPPLMYLMASEVDLQYRLRDDQAYNFSTPLATVHGSCRAPEYHLLFLAGSATINGTTSWAVAVVDMAKLYDTITTSLRITHTSSFLTLLPSADVPHARKASSCVYVRRGLQTNLYLTLHGDSDLVVARYSINENSAQIHTQQPVVKQQAALATATVRSFLVDDVSSTGSFFVNYADTSVPSIMYKINLDSCHVTGSRELLHSEGKAERVITATANPHTRSVWALVAIGTSKVAMVQFNTFAVTGITPHLTSRRGIADTQGGTLITVHGEGFSIQQGQVFCLLDGVEELDFVRVIDTRRVVCRTRASTGDCTGSFLEIALFEKERATNNQLVLQRVPTPSVQAVSPTHMSYIRDEAVEISGFGFMETPHLRCRVGLLEHTADFVSATLVRCNISMPREPSAGTMMEVTLDGQVYGASNVPFAIYGGASGLKSNVTTVSIKADVRTLPPIRIVAHDKAGNSLENGLDLVLENDVPQKVRRTYHLRLTERHPDANAYEDSLSDSIMQSFNVTGYDGHVDLHNVTLENPPTGRLVLEVAEPNLGSYTWEIIVTAGKMKRVYIQRQPSPTAPLDATLPIQPRARIHDAAGNTLSLSAVQSQTSLTGNIHGRAEFRAFVNNTNCTPALLAELRKGTVAEPVVVEDTGNCYSRVSVPSMPMDKSGDITFDLLWVVGYHLVSYRIVIDVGTLENGDFTPILDGVQSQPIQTGSCSDGLYSVPYTSLCKKCPPLAVCDGTSVILTAKNAWRASVATTHFYDCGSRQSCKERVEVGTCEKGYSDLKCAVCDDGYAKTSTGACSACPSPGEIRGLIIAGIILLLVVLSIMVLQNVKTTAELRMLPILTKQLISHLQTSNQLKNSAMELPGTLDSLFAAQGTVSDVDFDTYALQCAYRTRVQDVFLAYLGAPLLICFVSFIIGGMVSMLKYVVTKWTEYKEMLRIDRALDEIPDKAKVEAIEQQQNYDGYHIDTSKFQVGERVRLKHNYHVVKHECRAVNVWHSKMEHYLGRCGTVLFPDADGTVQVGYDDGQAFWFPSTVLEKHSFSVGWCHEIGEARRQREKIAQGIPQYLIGFFGWLHGVLDGMRNGMQDNVKQEMLRRQQVVEQLEAYNATTEEPVEDGEPAEPMGNWMGWDDVDRELRVPKQPTVMTHKALSQLTRAVSAVSTLATVNRRAQLRLNAVKRGDSSLTRDSSMATNPQMRAPLPNTPSVRRGSNGSSGAGRRGSAGEESLAFVVHRPHFRRIYFITCVTLFYLVYPTLVRKCSTVLDCDTIFLTDTPEGERSFLNADYSVSCDDDSYAPIRLLGIVFSFLYGLGIPAALAYLILFIKRTRGTEFTEIIFAFLVNGYKEKLITWECLSMVRKVVLIFIFIFIEDPYIQVYCAMWVLTVVLVAHFFFQPYVDSSLNILEGLSLASVVVTLNLGLLFFYNPDEMLQVLLEFVLLFANVGIMLIYAALITRELYRKVASSLDDDLDANDAEKENTALIETTLAEEEEEVTQFPPRRGLTGLSALIRAHKDRILAHRRDAPSAGGATEPAAPSEQVPAQPMRQPSEKVVFTFPTLSICSAEPPPKHTPDRTPASRRRSVVIVDDSSEETTDDDDDRVIPMPALVEEAVPVPEAPQGNTAPTTPPPVVRSLLVCEDSESNVSERTPPSTVNLPDTSGSVPDVDRPLDASRRAFEEPSPPSNKSRGCSFADAAGHDVRKHSTVRPSLVECNITLSQEPSPVSKSDPSARGAQRTPLSSTPATPSEFVARHLPSNPVPNPPPQEVEAMESETPRSAPERGEQRRATYVLDPFALGSPVEEADPEDFNQDDHQKGSDWILPWGDRDRDLSSGLGDEDEEEDVSVCHRPSRHTTIPDGQLPSARRPSLAFQ